MDTDDGWPRVWAEMTDEELRDRLRHYLFLAAAIRINTQNALPNSWLRPTSVGRCCRSSENVVF
jgi:hypothetical protein